MIKPLTVEPLKKVILNVTGRFFRCREASAAFKLRVGTDTYTLEGGDEFTVRDNDPDFQQLTFENLSDTDDLLVDFFAGKNVIRTAYVKLPRTRMVGRDVDIANNGTQDFSGLDEFGKRRKQFTISLRSGTGGYVHVLDADEGTLLAILDSSSSLGVGFALETDANIEVRNKTGIALSSSAGTPDIAVAETFYR